MNWTRVTIGTVVLFPILGEGMVYDFDLEKKELYIRLIIGNKTLKFTEKDWQDNGGDVMYYGRKK